MSARLPVLRTDDPDDPKRQSARRLIAGVARRALVLRGWTGKEFAYAVGRSQAQVSHWLSGQDRLPLEDVLAIESMRQPIAVALAELAGAEVTTTIRPNIAAPGEPVTTEIPAATRVQVVLGPARETSTAWTVR